MRKAKRNTNMEMKLERIEKLSSENPKMEFNWLIQHFSKENLISCFHELDGKKAVGIDGKTKSDYEENLEGNIESLIERMKGLKYYPAPVKEVKIPKGNGKYRPIGISVIEDKIVQLMYAKILNAIYEPLFIEESYGFRPGRSCHDAIRNIHKYLSGCGNAVVIDIDLSNFFGTIDHRKLIQILEMKIKDRTFIRYIVRMLRAGVLADGELRKSDEGTAQGSCVSPVLANIFAHYAMDVWLREVVPGHTRGKVHMVRYADDLVICTNRVDAPRILKALEGRLDRFSLRLNSDKTQIVDFSRYDYEKGKKQGTFNFLGFTLFIGRSRKGRPIVKIKTAKKTFATKLKAISEWCKKNRNNYRLAELWKSFRAKMKGHINYYGISHNFERMAEFINQAKRIFFKWMNRRSQRKSFNWKKFSLYEMVKPLPKPAICHRLF